MWQTTVKEFGNIEALFGEKQMKVKLTKKNIIRWSIELVILIGMIIAFVVINKNIDIENEKIEKEGYKYSVDKLVYHEETGELTTLGWLIKEGVPCSDESSRGNLKMWLAKDGKRDDMLEIQITSYERQDINKKYGKDEIDYSYCGYMGSVTIGKEILQNKYRILFQYDSNVEKYFYTTRYLDKGELKTEYTQLDYKYTK